MLLIEVKGYIAVLEQHLQLNFFESFEPWLFIGGFVVLNISKIPTREFQRLYRGAKLTFPGSVSVCLKQVHHLSWVN